MKDKNGVELKHGDIVRVDFVCVNAPMCTCYCKVNMDKLEVISGKEPETYYTREITKVGASLTKQMENDLFTKYGSVKEGKEIEGECHDL